MIDQGNLISAAAFEKELALLEESKKYLFKNKKIREIEAEIDKLQEKINKRSEDIKTSIKEKQKIRANLKRCEYEQKTAGDYSAYKRNQQRINEVSEEIEELEFSLKNNIESVLPADHYKELIDTLRSEYNKDIEKRSAEAREHLKALRELARLSALDRVKLNSLLNHLTNGLTLGVHEEIDNSYDNPLARLIGSPASVDKSNIEMLGRTLDSNGYAIKIENKKSY